MSQAFDAFQQDGAGVACRVGCNFCCHLRVMIYPHEAIALFRYLKSRMPKEQAEAVQARLIANAAAIGKMTRDAHASNRVACAFLVDGKCSAYEARPSACSGYHSLSREHCENDLNNPTGAPIGIPVLEGLGYVAAALDEGMERALSEEGLSATRIELHTALAALIRNPALIERWRSGRDLIRPSGSGG